KINKAITIIIGLGETIEDFPKLVELIKKWEINRINFYRLVPHDGTDFDKGPKTNYYIEWIAKTRIEFPKLEIIAGSWPDKTTEVPLLLKAGANAITKLPAIKLFGKQPAREIVEGAKKAGRSFKSELIKYPKINIDEELAKLDFGDEMKEKIKEKYEIYYKKLKKFE
ncbi:MAG: hypothetical protein AABW92_03080, partial [Nanoarchaeota archaeon]